jgi:DNA repair protein RadD
MCFDDLLSRCDVEVFQRFLGPECVRLLGLLDSKMSSVTFLRELVVQSVGPAALLLKGECRIPLFELLRPNEAQQLCQVLKLPPTPNPYDSLVACSFARGSQREATLFDFFELAVPPVEAVELSPALQRAKASYPLFPHQRVASHSVLKQLHTPPHRVLLHMPTGSGKTRTAMSAICDHLRGRQATVAIWVAHSEELCDQAADEFLDAWSAIGDRTLDLRRFWGQRDLDLSAFNDGILIAGLPKLIQFTVRGRSKSPTEGRN